MTPAEAQDFLRSHHHAVLATFRSDGRPQLSPVGAVVDAEGRVVISTRESLEMLRAAGEEHGKALIVNTASIAGKAGQGWLSIYSATKAGVIGFSQATQSEIGDAGIQVTALCPAFVDTPMTDFVKGQVEAEAMIRPEDIAESVRFLLRTSRACIVPEIVFLRPGDGSALGT